MFIYQGLPRAADNEMFGLPSQAVTYELWLQYVFHSNVEVSSYKCLAQGHSKQTYRLDLHTNPFYAERHAGRCKGQIFKCFGLTRRGSRQHLNLPTAEPDALITKPITAFACPFWLSHILIYLCPRACFSLFYLQHLYLAS